MTCHIGSLLNFAIFFCTGGIPVLNGLLSASYFLHYVLLSRAIFLLSQEDIAPEDLALAENCLCLFVQNYAALYGQRGSTLNLHNLLHLTDCVRNTGPLFVNNCFVFEDLNGYILQHIHGTQGIDTQIVNVVSILKVTPHLFQLYKSSSSKEFANLYGKLMGENVHGTDGSKDLTNAPGVCAAGSTRRRKLSPTEESSLITRYGVLASEITCFDRINMYRKGFSVYGIEYDRLKRRHQSTVQYCPATEHAERATKQVAYGIVKCFLQFTVQGVIENVALVTPMKTMETIGCVDRVQILDKVDVVSVLSIQKLCNYIPVQNEHYVCIPPNRYDRD